MHTHAINHQGQLVMMLNHRHLGLIQFKKQINSEGTYFGGVLSAACWCWLNINAWWGRHAAFITLPLSSSLLRGYIFKVNDSMLKGLLCCLETLETTTACTWARHTRKTSEKWKWEGWIWVIHFQETALVQRGDRRGWLDVSSNDIGTECAWKKAERDHTVKGLAVVKVEADSFGYAFIIT